MGNREQIGEKIRAGNFRIPEPIDISEPLQTKQQNTSDMSHLSAFGMQRDLQQFVGCLVQKVGVQHADFTHVAQPELGRGLPETLPDLEYTHTQTEQTHDAVQGTKSGRGLLLCLDCTAEPIHTNRDAMEPLTPSCPEAPKSMCKLAGNDPATISSRRPEVPRAAD